MRTAPRLHLSSVYEECTIAMLPGCSSLLQHSYITIARLEMLNLARPNCRARLAPGLR